MFSPTSRSLRSTVCSALLLSSRSAPTASADTREVEPLVQHQFNPLVDLDAFGDTLNKSHVTSANSSKLEPYTFVKEDVEAFVQHQFDVFFVDCDAFVSTFQSNFIYCDAAPCVAVANELLMACKATEGSKQIVQALNVLPASYPDVFNLDYSNIAITGRQTVFLPIPGTPIFPQPIPLCFNFSIQEELRRDRDSPYGFLSKSWRGFYSMDVGAVCS